MRIALFSDIHSNIHALNACLNHAREQSPDQLAFLGDLVGYGAAPAEVMDVIMFHASEGAWVIKGNHDEMALGLNNPSMMEGSIGAEWTRAQLSKSHLDFLENLPLVLNHEGCLFVHASAKEPGAWTYIDSELRAGLCIEVADQEWGANRVFTGHVHHQVLFYQTAVQKMMRFVPTPGVPIPLSKQRPVVATIGSVGQPRDGDTRSMYACYDSEQSTLTFHRVQYDFAKAAQDIREAGLPEKLAHRIEHGR